MKVNTSSIQTNQMPGMISGANTGGTGNAASGSSFTMDIRDMEQGQVFTGVITKISGGEVTIQVGQEFLQARFEESVNLCVGETLNFMIKSNDKNKIYIKPLPVAGDPVDNTMYKALKAANLPPNDRNIDIVMNLLQNSMPVDKKTIVSLITASLQNKDVAVADLVRMKKYDLDLTKDIVDQFMNYKDNHHQLSQEIETIEQQFPETLLKMAEVMEGKEIAHLIHAFLGEVGELPVSKLILPKQSNTFTYLTDMVKNGELKKPDDFFSLLGHCLEHGTYEKDALISFIKNPVFKEMVQEQIRMNWTLPPEHITKQEVQEFYKILHGRTENMGNILEDFTSQEMSGKAETFERAEIQSKIEILEKKGVPENLNKSGEEAGRSLSSALLPVSESISTFSSALKQVNSNILFMEQLNKHFVYMQMPVRLKNQIAHSDIYVYTRKKTRNPDKEGVSLLMQLNMEQLGSLQVFVTLFGTALQATFTLSDQQSADLLKSNMNRLGEQLSSKGFSLKSEVKHCKKEKSVDFVEDFLEKDETTVKITRYSFDVRA